LNTWAGPNAKPPPLGSTGLYHFAILLPSRLELAKVIKRVIDCQVQIDGASDHHVSQAVYLRDPDGNGIELYVDRDPSEWIYQDGELVMTVDPLDLNELLAELS